MKKALAVVVMALLGMAIWTTTATANIPRAGSDCDVGVTAGAAGYDPYPYNQAEVFFDGQLVYDNEDFGDSFSFTYPNPDPYSSHTYQVDIWSDDESQAQLHTGLVTIPPCEVTDLPPPTTTTPPPTTVPPAPPAPPRIVIVTPPPAPVAPPPVVVTARFTG